MPFESLARGFRIIEQTAGCYSSEVTSVVLNRQGFHEAMHVSEPGTPVKVMQNEECKRKFKCRGTGWHNLLAYVNQFC